MIWADRVAESSTTTGTGNFALGGALVGYQTLSAAYPVTTYPYFDYCIVAVDTNGIPTGDWEQGKGYLTDTTHLVRSVVYANSLGTTALVSFAAGTKTVFTPFSARRFNRVPQSLKVFPQDAGNTNDITEDTLNTYTLPAGTLDQDGDYVDIFASGTNAADTHTHTIKLYFGSTVIATWANTTSGLAWRIWARVVRRGATSQISIVQVINASNNGGALSRVTSTEDLTTDLTIKVTGQTSIATLNDVVCNFMSIDFMPVGG